MVSTLKKIEKNTARPVTPLGILVQQLEHIVTTAKTESVSAELQTSLDNAYQLASGLDPYLEDCTTSESEPLANLTTKTQQEDWSKRFSDGETVKALEQEMLSGHIEGQLLKMLVSISKSKRVLEIGMFTGYSALAIAEALPDDGYLIACEVDDYVSKFAQNCFAASPHGKKITVKVAPAIETMKQLVEEEVEAVNDVGGDHGKGEVRHRRKFLLTWIGIRHRVFGRFLGLNRHRQRKQYH